MPRLAITGLLLVLGGCGPHQEPSQEARFLLDPLLADTAGFRQANVLDCVRGDLKLGAGWSQPRMGGQLRRWTRVLSASKGSSLFFSSLGQEELELVLDCQPISGPSTPDQTLTLVANGRTLEKKTMEPGFETYRLKVPWTHTRHGMNRLDVEFGFHASPQDLGLGPGRRRFSATCSRIELVNPGLSRRQSQQRASRSLGPDRPLRLVAGSPLALALPVGRNVELRLEDVDGVSPNGTLRLETWAQGRPTARLWSGSLVEAEDAVVHLQTPTRGATQMVLTLEEPPSLPDAAPSSVKLRLLVSSTTNRALEASGSPPDVFVYVVDTLRADALTLYGSARPTSPRIEEFAQDAVLFRRAASTSSWTFPATMSILTGLLPSRHGHVAGQPPGDESVPLLSGLAAARGYETLGLSQSAVVSGKDRFEVGFHRFYLTDGLSRGGSESANVRWFLWRHLVARDDARRPLFTYIHTVDPHAPYLPQGNDLRFARKTPGLLPTRYYRPQSFLRFRETLPDWEVRRLRALYDGEVAHADREFGEFLDFLRLTGFYDNSLIILTSDHGEEFREHGGFSHERTLYQELLHVPLLVKFPQSWQAGRAVDTRVSLADITPTVLDIMGAAPEASSFDGTSLRPLAMPGKTDQNRRVYSEIVRKGKKKWTPVDLRSVLVGHTKCIHSATGQTRFGDPVQAFRAFDLRYDPQEQQSRQPAVEEPCREILHAWLDADQVEQERAIPDSERNEEELERLRALGYIDD